MEARWYGCAVPEHECHWIIETDGETPREAAAEAERLRSLPNSQCKVYYVRDQQGFVFRVDLDEHESEDREVSGEGYI